MNDIAVNSDPAPAAAPLNMDVFETLPVAVRELHEAEKNPRRIYVGLAELAASIKADGLRVPIVARPRLDGGGYEIAAGHRRYRAAKMAGVEVLPVQIRDLTDAQLIDWLAFENDHRSDLNEIERAQGWKLWMDENAAGVPDLIAKLGLKPAYVYKTLKLLEAIPEAQEAYVYGKIKVSHLEHIARIPTTHGQRLALRACEPPEFDREKIPTARELAVWISKNLHTRLTEAPFSRADATLVASVGACGPCEHRLGNFPDYNPGEDLADMCTRRECYDQKVMAHVNAAIADVKRGQRDLVLVSELGGGKPEGILAKSEWREARIGDQVAKDGFVVEGPRMGHEIRVVVQEAAVQERIPVAPQQSPVITVNVVPADPKPAPRKKTAAEIEQERKNREAEDRQRREDDERMAREAEERGKKLKPELDVRLAILDEMLKLVKWPLRPQEFYGLVEPESVCEFPDPLEPALERLFGASKFPVYENLSDTDAARLFLLFAVEGDFQEHTLGRGCDRLHAAAKRYGVDVARIREAAMESEGGTRKEVIKNLPTVEQSPKKTPKKKAAPVQHLHTLLPKKTGAKKAAPKKAAAKKSAPKKDAKKSKGKK